MEPGGPHLPRFSEFADRDGKVLDGDKIRIEDVLNREVTVLGHKVRKGKFRTERCLTLQVELDGERRVVFTGSEVLIGLMEKYCDRCPFRATIKKVDRFYTFV